MSAYCEVSIYIHMYVTGCSCCVCVRVSVCLCVCVSMCVCVCVCLCLCVLKVNMYYCVYWYPLYSLPITVYIRSCNRIVSGGVLVIVATVAILSH